ncbi:ribosome biogenesis GTPase Der [Rickettsia prowazekii]|uniref:GTPase Der n=2 Tax=Rickettsia prowazekii TaxID=782 RepID=DER_RICPR|nr:ribosome biogenesis GTPase Der [Rickettsia prowazekii]Q9ZCP6.1 RecName: Full=GTPase Der; AltName: Full=GTP-binding protein EngA [Rickettsia prowazekii str. Madrid E]ADE30224.1 GTP-binding protein [Rickettsia prowazekii str. Rp22]AFE49476.1 GTP-binding protein Der [Rickettsia prowazekii str. Chernikova]AFE51166.1 GTP-binding protein Der [Rickettsia prowazekii str. BuV67-CWPP]AFE52002.1 GTP-binding protein Der [Rickettsia prowazekii str. Dachau]AGJ01664.1 2-polyprenylphenol 6-hydroxylase [Ri
MTKKIITLVGRPNVGKSTLFNRLSIRKKAIVHDLPGVTRDRKYTDGKIGSFEFLLIDTPGLEENPDNMGERLMGQTTQAILEADLICFMVDGKSGVLPDDKLLSNFVRKYNKHCILVVNKCEKAFDFDKEYYKLGFDSIVIISAEHGIGLIDLYDAIISKLSVEESIERNIADPFRGDCLQIVVSGRPNAGKSTFINAIINDERLLTGPEAGITRESIEVDWQYKNTHIKLIDTAGLRKKSTITASLEKLSTSDTINSIKFANTVILMIDALAHVKQQDFNIASHIVNEGRSIIIVVNKWDLVKESEKEAFQKEFYYQINTHLPQIKGVPVLFISAINKQNIEQVLDACLKIYKIWNKKITTNKLNKWLDFTTKIHPLPLQKCGRRVRIKYMTQIKTRPPTFKLFSNNPGKITDSYTRYLVNNMRDAFDMHGIPIRFTYVKNKNPYV